MINEGTATKGCALFQSPMHSGRSVLIAAGGGSDGRNKVEIWDFTVKNY